jgi:hypothetical protein
MTSIEYRVAHRKWSDVCFPGREKQGETYTSSGICQDGKSPAFCARQGELHATNAGTGTCRLDRSEARCRSVAAKAQKVFPAALRCAIHASRATHASRPLRAFVAVARVVHSGPENKPDSQARGKADRAW